MHERIVTFIEQHNLLPDQGTLVVAVSGGADSLCLLHLLHRLCGPGKHFPRIILRAAHLNHQLRGSASELDAAYVKQIVDSWGIPLTLGCVDVPTLARQEKRSLEDAARVARYRFLREVAQGQPIAVAHHLDDQVETLILHWLRGEGIAGMLGLQPRQQDIIRPLLPVARADTLAYCEKYQIEPLEDGSNTDPRFLRNRIRHELLPLLQKMNPGIRETLVRNAEVIQVDVAWIEMQVEDHWTAVVVEENSQCIQLSNAALLALPLSIQRHLLRRVTAKLSKGQSPLELRHYALLEELLQRDPSNKEVTLHLPQRLRATRYRDKLLFEHTQSQPASTTVSGEPVEVLLTIPGRVSVPGTPWMAVAEPIPETIVQTARVALQHEDWQTVWRILPHDRYTVYIDSNCIHAPLLVRTWRPGDRLQPLGMAHEKKVQDMFVDRHIPRSERGHIPLFFSASHCIWLAGVQLGQQVRLNSMTQDIVRLSIKPIQGDPVE